MVAVMKMASEFRTFILRGNVVDLAVGVAIGASFGNVIAAFNAALITPLISIVGVNLSSGSWFIFGERFAYGILIQAAVTFLLTALVVFLFVVKPVNAVRMKFEGPPPTPAPTRNCPECTSTIPTTAKRCAHCTARVL